jgi:uncharacterized protein YicC (UPF0701 family)
MDVKEEDKSEESMKNHITYYISLCKIISNITEEKNLEREPAIKNYLDNRIDAMEKDKKRIRDMFPEIKEEEWNDYSN